MSINKILFTIKNIKKISYHHYGNKRTSIIKFLYCYFFKINTFVVLGAKLDKNFSHIIIDEKFTVKKPTIKELK